MREKNNKNIFLYFWYKPSLTSLELSNMAELWSKRLHTLLEVILYTAAHHDNTSSNLNTVVKQYFAWMVLGWVTALELQVILEWVCKLI